MQIHVTQDHIDRGVPHCPGFCPIAIALRNATGKIWHIGITIAHIWTGGQTVETICKLNEEAQMFVKRFDTDVNQQPFSFEFDHEESSSDE